MDTSYNSIQQDISTLYGKNAPKRVLHAIQAASKKSGVDFSYLVQQAKAESNFNTDIKAKTSSATGLYQFIDSTWMQMVERYGADYGIDTDGMSKSEILALRKDPKASSFMAAAFASENERFLNANWGGDVGSTELYFAHFLGAAGASAFLSAKDENPLQRAADLFPQAARANRNVFYDPQSGQPRTLAQVYDFFDKKFQGQIDAPAKTPEPAKENMNSTYVSLYSANPNSLSKSLVMQRVQAMRDGFHVERREDIYSGHTQRAAGLSHEQTNLYGLLKRPVELMLLTQVSKPSYTIRDKS